MPAFEYFKQRKAAGDDRNTLFDILWARTRGALTAHGTKKSTAYYGIMSLRSHHNAVEHHVRIWWMWREPFEGHYFIEGSCVTTRTLGPLKRLVYAKTLDQFFDGKPPAMIAEARHLCFKIVDSLNIACAIVPGPRAPCRASARDDRIDL